MTWYIIQMYHEADRFVKWSCSANFCIPQDFVFALEILQSCTKPSWRWLNAKETYSIAKTLELCLFCINPSIICLFYPLIHPILTLQHGAIYIYDTDDDNIPTGRLQGFHLTSPTHSLLLTTSNLTVNPYIHFGQSTLWPRGYPMDHLGKTTPQDYKLCEMKSPSIQIGLADGDPDLDSVARLTRKLANSHMNIHFDPAAPLFVVPEGTYVPINSQVTMFRYKAFWSLVFPMSVTFRTADIYRGYWQQRLLWLIGDRVGNLGPIVRHDRSYHNYIDDALQEYDLLKMGKLLEVMNRWQCTRLHFFSCVTALAWELVHGGFWEREDVDLIDAWLTDLASIGYVSPMLRDPPHPACMQSSVPQQVHFQAHEQTTTLIHSSTNFQPPDTNNLETVHTFIQNTCHFSSLPRPAGSASFPHLLLVIQLESAGTILPVLEAWYRPHFPNILYCGHQDQVAQDLLARFRVSFLGLRQGDGHVSCMSHALRMGYNVTGYLFAPETALLRPRVLEAHRASQLWLTQNWEVSEPAQIESCRKQTIHCQEFNTKSLSTLSERTAELRVGSKLQLKIKACFSKLSSNPALKNKSWYLRDLVFYLPSRLTQQFQQISAVYSNLKGEDFDIVTVLLLECLEVAPEYLTFSSTLGAQTGPEDYVFPYQPQEVISKGPVNTHFCQNVV